MERQIFNLDIPHNYLEMARSVFTGIHEPKEIKKQEDENTKGKKQAGILFAMTSATVIYSYMAIESFINYWLYKIWEDSRYFHDKIEEINKAKPKLKSVARFDDLYIKYGKEDNFEQLKNTDIGDLKKRINVVCEQLEIPPIHRKNKKLWNSFNELLSDARHFLIHPFPDPIKFQSFMQKLLMETEAGKYSETASGIIKHFYIEKKEEPPDWIAQNTVFEIIGFGYCHNKKTAFQRCFS